MILRGRAAGGISAPHSEHPCSFYQRTAQAKALRAAPSHEGIGQGLLTPAPSPAARGPTGRARPLPRSAAAGPPSPPRSARRAGAAPRASAHAVAPRRGDTAPRPAPRHPPAPPRCPTPPSQREAGSGGTPTSRARAEAASRTLAGGLLARDASAIGVEPGRVWAGSGCGCPPGGACSV